MRLRELCWVALFLVLAGCAGGTADAPADSAGITGEITAGPAFPADGPARSVRAVETITLEGMDFHAQSGTCTPGLSSLTLDPGYQELSYAIYRFQLGAFSVDTLDFIITPNNPARSWIGLPDYDARAWDLTGFETGLASLPVTAANLSPNGFLYVAVISWHNSETVIDQLSVDLDLPEWTAHVIDDQGNPGVVLRACGDGGNPAVAYTADGADELRYARATAAVPASGADWDISVAASATGATALELVVAGDGPWLAWTDSVTGDNAFARATTASPATPADWDTTFPSRDTTGECIALAAVNGTPAVAYVDPGMSIHSIDYTYSALAEPAALEDWLVTEAISSVMTPPFSEFSTVSLLVHDGLPHLVYYDVSKDRLYFAACDSAVPQGNTNWSKHPVDADGNGLYCRGVEYGGLPALAYLNPAVGSLIFAQADEWTPGGTTDWGNRFVIDASGDAAGPVDVVRAGDGLGVAYYDSATGEILYAWVDTATTTAGTDWRIMAVVTDAGPDPAFSLARMPDGRPCLIYRDPATAALLCTLPAE